MIITINNLLQFIIIFVLSLVLILSVKTKFYFDKSFQKRNQKIKNIDESNNLNRKKIINFKSKTKAISSLWSFNHLKNSKKIKLINIKEKSKKIIKNNWIIFFIACHNSFYKNTIKAQGIIINGWKISLIE